MERYFLIISKENAGASATEHVKASLDARHELSRPSFLAVLNLVPPSDDIHEDNLDQICWKSYDELDDDLNCFTLTNWETLREGVDILADDLPELGKYFTEVMCFADEFTHLTPLYFFHMATTLHRLRVWHNAHIVFHRSHDLNQEEESTLERWALKINASITDDHWPFPELKLWYGGLEMPMEVTYHGCELVLIGDVQDALKAINTHSLLRKLVLGKEVTHVATYLTYLTDVFHDVRFDYLLSPVKLLLKVPHEKRVSEDCCSLIDFLERTPLLALVFGLHFTCSGEKQDASDFEAWIKCMGTGRIPDDLPQTRLPENCPQLKLLLYYNPEYCESGRSLVAHVLSEPCDLDLSSIMPDVLAADMLVEESEGSVDWDKLIPRLEEVPCDCFKPERDTMQCVDPSDWPERRYLLLKELNKERNKSSLDVLSPPPPASRKVINLKVSDFSNYFDTSGLPKKSSGKDKTATPHVIRGGKGKFPVKVDHTVQDVLCSKWPDVQTCHFHDIYFNSSSFTEEKEVVCNQLKSQFILEETSSSDPNHNQARVICVVPQGKAKSSKRQVTPKKEKSKARPSYPVYQKRFSPKRTTKSFSKAGSKPTTTEPVHAVKPSTNIKGQIPKNIKQLPDSGIGLSRPEPPTLELSLRRSPRSKVKHAVRSSHSSNITMSEDLSEKHKMKLREAVAFALETEGILLNSPSFKLYGRRLFNVCKAFVKDILGKGNTSGLMKKIAVAHVKQVIEFENLKS